MIDQAFFRKAYDADANNKNLQKWDGVKGYWWWVKYFYKNDIWEGWDEVEKQLLNKVAGTSTQEFLRLKVRLNSLGKRLCAEWAKHNDVSKVLSPDLEKFLIKLRDGSALETTVSEIENHLTQKGV